MLGLRDVGSVGAVTEAELVSDAAKPPRNLRKNSHGHLLRNHKNKRRESKVVCALLCFMLIALSDLFPE